MPNSNKQEIIKQLSNISLDLQSTLRMLRTHVGLIEELIEPKKRGRPVGTRNKEGHRAGRPRKSFNPMTRAGDL